MKIQITVNILNGVHSDLSDVSFKEELLDFSPVSGRWSVSSNMDGSLVHIVSEIAKVEASKIVDYKIHPDDFDVELFAIDGRSIENTDGVKGGRLVITRIK